MHTRKLGWTDLELTTVGLGTWAMGGGGWKFGWGPQDDKQSIETIHNSLELGINWVDTAAVYGLGHSEEVMGEAIKGLAELPIIATKCGRIWDERGNIGSSLSRESIRTECEASLKRLKVDVIDLYQIHWSVPDEDIEEGWGTMAELVQEGKIRYAGVSNFSVEQLERILPIHPVASLQPPYSMLKRGIEDSLLGFCSENNIGVIVYSPMQKGLLTGKMTHERIENLPEDDHRKRDPLFQEPVLSRILQWVEQLRPLAENSGRSLAQLAIAWVLARPEVTSAIVGARSMGQIEETVRAGNWVLSKKDIQAIDGLLKTCPSVPNIAPVSQKRDD